MTGDDAQSDPHDPADEELDRLLAQARWEEPSPESERRLAVEWTTLRHKRQGWPILWTLAAAASVAVMVGTSVILLERMRPNPVLVREDLDVKYLMAEGEPIGQVESHDATLLERFALLRAAPFVPIAAAAPVAAEQPQMAEETESQDQAVGQLLAQLEAPSIERRFIAARELSQFEEPEVVNALMDMAQRDASRREALVALKLSSSPLAARALKDLELSRAALEQLAADTRGMQPGM